MFGSRLVAAISWSSFLEFGLLDVLRTVLALGLAWAVWTITFPGIGTRHVGSEGEENPSDTGEVEQYQPVADFVKWGIRYPLLFVVFVLFTLIIWGWIGQDYGLQGLFFDENWLVQFGLGAAAAVLMLQFIYHYYALDENRGMGWLKSVQRSMGAWEAATEGRGGESLFKSLGNGLLESLDARDPEADPTSPPRDPT